jgi:hypothetical protein
MENTLVTLYCLVDDFCKEFEAFWEKTMIESGMKRRKKLGQLSVSEIITIYVHFHQSHYRDFKNYYINYVQTRLAALFPKLVCYARFVALIKGILVPLYSFLQCFSGEKPKFILLTLL